VKGRPRRATIYPAVCPQCGRERWLKKADARKAERQRCLCYRCAQSEKGRLGWLATVERYGLHFTTRHVQAYRLANPSNLERIVSDWLAELGVSYEREVWLATHEQVYLLDFVAQGNLAIEVNGEFVHRYRDHHDQTKYQLIRRQYQLLVLHEFEVLTGAAFPVLEHFIRSGETQ
jgi:hypothetical protein